MKIRIYQINSDRDENRMMFLSHDRLERFQGSPEVDSKIYDKVYDKEVDCSNLEEVYTLLNIDHPEDYRGRSLSVSDVVEVYESDAIPQGFYFCDSFGFKQVTFHPEKCGISERMNEQSTEIISVLLVEPGKYPRMIEIEDSLEAMQRVVGGDIEEFMPYEDDIAIICNEEGKMNGMSPNRAIYSEPEEVEMTYGELTGRFRQAEREGRHISGYIVFTQDSFTEAYSEEQRTYAVSSNNKAFIEGMGGYSIYASSLDGSDPCVRLEAYMADEHISPRPGVRKGRRVMSEEKRMAGDYEIIQAVHIGDREIVVGENQADEQGLPYLVAYYESNAILGRYYDAIGSDDFTEIMEIYGQRISPITAERCTPISYDDDLNGKVIVIKPEVLRPEYRRATSQVKLCTGGFGADPHSRGSAVFCTEVYTGRQSRFERRDVLGVLEPEDQPKWVQHYLSVLQQTEKQKNGKEQER